VILLWSGGLSVLLFSLLWRFDILRLKPEVEESVSRRRSTSKEPQAKRSSLHIGSADLRVRSHFAKAFFLADSLPPAKVEESVSRRSGGWAKNHRQRVVVALRISWFKGLEATLVMLLFLADSLPLAEESVSSRRGGWAKNHRQKVVVVCI
jgi:hypothetical protein